MMSKVFVMYFNDELKPENPLFKFLKSLQNKGISVCPINISKDSNSFYICNPSSLQSPPPLSQEELQHSIIIGYSFSTGRASDSQIYKKNKFSEICNRLIASDSSFSKNILFLETVPYNNIISPIIPSIPPACIFKCIENEDFFIPKNSTTAEYVYSYKFKPSGDLEKFERICQHIEKIVCENLPYNPNIENPPSDSNHKSSKEKENLLDIINNLNSKIVVEIEKNKTAEEKIISLEDTIKELRTKLDDQNLNNKSNKEKGLNGYSFFNLPRDLDLLEAFFVLTHHLLELSKNSKCFSKNDPLQQEIISLAEKTKKELNENPNEVNTLVLNIKTELKSIRNRELSSKNSTKFDVFKQKALEIIRILLSFFKINFSTDAYRKSEFIKAINQIIELPNNLSSNLNSAKPSS